MVRYSRKSTLQTDRHKQSSGVESASSEKNERLYSGKPNQAVIKPGNLSLHRPQASDRLALTHRSQELERQLDLLRYRAQSSNAKCRL